MNAPHELHVMCFPKIKPLIQGTGKHFTTPNIIFIKKYYFV